MAMICHQGRGLRALATGDKRDKNMRTMKPHRSLIALAGLFTLLGMAAPAMAAQPAAPRLGAPEGALALPAAPQPPMVAPIL